MSPVFHQDLCASIVVNTCDIPYFALVSAAEIQAILPAQYSAHSFMYSAFVPLPSLPTATLPGKSNPPICSFPAVARDQPSQPRPDRACLLGGWATPILGACPRSMASRDRLPAVAHPWLSFPRQPDSFELNARSFADVAKPPSLPQGRRTARKPLEYLTRGVGVAVRRRQLSGSAMPKDSDDALTEPASRRLAGAVEPSRMHAVGQAIPGARRPGTAAALPCPSVPSC